jgi:hypothetical protein
MCGKSTFWILLTVTSLTGIYRFLWDCVSKMLARFQLIFVAFSHPHGLDLIDNRIICSGVYLFNKDNTTFNE